VLHDPVWYDHLPYLPFPDHWPVFSPKDKMGDWLEMYAKVMELNYWHSTLCTGARYDEAAGEWEVSLNYGGDRIKLYPKQLVLATGMSGFPYMPALRGADSFEGRLCHSSQFDAGSNYAGKNCVVLGSNNSAHDIAADLWEQGAGSVTMIQRSSSVVCTSDALMEHAWGKLYSQAALEAGITTEIADLTVASMPFKLLPAQMKPVYETIRRRDAQLYEGLEKAGFLFDFGEDGSGHPLDLPAARGRVLHRRRRLPADHRRPHQPEEQHRDQGHQPALGDARRQHRAARGPARVRDRLRLDERVGRQAHLAGGRRHGGQVLGPRLGHALRPRALGGRAAQHVEADAASPDCGSMAATSMQSRHYSLYLALQLKARMEDIPTPVYYVDPVHHKR